MATEQNAKWRNAAAWTVAGIVAGIVAAIRRGLLKSD